MSKFHQNGMVQTKSDVLPRQPTNPANQYHDSQLRPTRERDVSPPPQYEKQHKPRVPIVLHIKLAKDLVKEVKCFIDDDPNALAKNFCQENNLPPELTPVVQNMIKAQFNQALQVKMQKEAKAKGPTSVNSFMSSPSRDENFPVKDIRENNQNIAKKSEPGSRTNVRNDESKQELSHSKLVAKLDINIGPGQSRDLLLFEGEDPAEVAYFFCSQNDLPNTIIEVLVAKLRHAQELYYRKKGKASESGSSIAQAIPQSQIRSRTQLDKEDSIKSQIRSKSQLDKEESIQTVPGSKIISSRNRIESIDSPERDVPMPGSKVISSRNRIDTQERTTPVPGSKVISSRNRVESLNSPEKNTNGSKVINSRNRIDTPDRNRSKSPSESTSTRAAQEKIPKPLKESTRSKGKLDSRQTSSPQRPETLTVGVSDKTGNIKSSQLGSENKANSDTADTYERWQNLIRERRKIQQIESDTDSKGAVFNGRSSLERKGSMKRSVTPKGRSKTPKRELSPDEYYKLAMKSLIPADSSRAQIENINSEVARAEEESKRKLKKRETEDLIGRLYGDALHRKANEDEFKLFEMGVRPRREVTDMTFKPGFWERRMGSPDEKGRPLEEPRSPTPKDIREQKLAVREKKIVDNFTFKPYVSDASRRLLERKNRSNSPIHERLYTDGMASRKNKDVLYEIMLEETCPFQPNVDRHREREPEVGFFKRLAERELQKQDKKIDRKVLESQPLCDSATGQKLFHPKITKDKYYYKVKEKDEMKEREAILSSQAVARERQRKANTSKSLREIFDKLDDDKDGYISAQKIELSKLDGKVLEALIKVFDIIEDRKLRVDSGGFQRLVEDNLNAEQRNVLKSEYDEFEGDEQRMLQPNSQNTVDKSFPSSRENTVTITSKTTGSRTQRSPGERKKVKVEDVERVTTDNLTRHYQRLLGKREGDSVLE